MLHIITLPIIDHVMCEESFIYVTLLLYSYTLNCLLIYKRILSATKYTKKKCHKNENDLNLESARI